MVSRSYERPRVELWPVALRERLPLIPIPLRQGDRNATINLQQLLHEQFDAAGYADYIHRGHPQPPLSDAHAVWAAGLAARMNCRANPIPLRRPHAWRFQPIQRASTRLFAAVRPKLGSQSIRLKYASKIY
jgi:hypothetical protein